MNRRNFFAALAAGVPVCGAIRDWLGEGAGWKAPSPVHEQLELPLNWMTLPRIPVRSRESELAALLNNAVVQGREVRFRYDGGSTPGEARRVVPALLFRVEGCPQMYLTAHCPKRGTHRTFRLDRCRNLRVV